MFVILLGSILIFSMVNELAIVDEPEQNTIVYRSDVNQPYQQDVKARVEPLSAQKFTGVVRQAYDYSCGSAALTTLLDFHLGQSFKERQVMEGLLRFGETERIIERRGFSLLDMKRLVSALGYSSGGFKAQMADLKTLEHPAIAPIEYAGFKHFVVVRAVYQGHVYVADPALGNISFTTQRFQEIWDNNVIFIVFPNDKKTRNGLALNESDLRLVDDQLIAELAYKEFPYFAVRKGDDIGNLMASVHENARSSLVAKRDAQGDVLKDSDGNILYEFKLDSNSSRPNVRVPTRNNEKIIKHLRFAPK